MANKYVYAVYHDGPKIEVENACSMSQLKEKLRERYDSEGEWEDLPWDDFLDTLGTEKDIWIGDIYDVEEL